MEFRIRAKKNSTSSCPYSAFSNPRTPPIRLLRPSILPGAQDSIQPALSWALAGAGPADTYNTFVTLGASSMFMQLGLAFRTGFSILNWKQWCDQFGRNTDGWMAHIEESHSGQASRGFHEAACFQMVSGNDPKKTLSNQASLQCSNSKSQTYS